MVLTQQHAIASTLFSVRENEVDSITTTTTTTIITYYGDIPFWSAGRLHKREDTSPNSLGRLLELSQVTYHSQLSRPIALGHYTSWNTCCEGGNTSCDVTPPGQLSWKHFGIDAYFPWVPRSLGRRSGDPRAHDTIDADQIIQ